MTLHVVVLMGGWSSERSVSLSSGAGIVKAIESLGHKVTGLDMQRDVAQQLAQLKPDVVFNALHGAPGEDGCVQGLMDLMDIAYTHSGVCASAVAMDKQLSKTLLMAAGIKMPGGAMVKSVSLFEADPLLRPYVLKPNAEGSSVGVVIITQNSKAGYPISRDARGPWHDFEELLAEPFIPGKELTVAVLKDRPLAVTELQVSSGFYDFDAKYTDGLTKHILPALVHPAIAAEAMATALKAHQILGCTGVSRSDFRYDDTNSKYDTKTELGQLYLLEVNTQPGMTPLSLVPEQAQYVGISYAQLVQLLIDDALKRHADKRRGR
jgi:D-alanine-D-alanine ligase